MKLPIVATVLIACLFAQAVQAHAHLEKSTPVDGSTLSAPPAAVEMTFSEAARLTALWIQRDQEPRKAIKDLPTIASGTLRVSLPALASGTYVVTWRVLAADGHVTSGVLHFTVAPR
jgi:methionine-rich copper-binding protein CopC